MVLTVPDDAAVLVFTRSGRLRLALPLDSESAQQPHVIAAVTAALRLAPDQLREALAKGFGE